MRRFLLFPFARKEEVEVPFILFSFRKEEEVVPPIRAPSGRRGGHFPSLSPSGRRGLSSRRRGSRYSPPGSRGRPCPFCLLQEGKEEKGDPVSGQEVAV
eukprot:3596607-Pyramimonas_sp.AAC.1